MTTTSDSGLAASASAKLSAALAYLGDRLTTHRASRFKPRYDFLLDEWLGLRRGARLQAGVPASEANRTNLEAIRRFLLRESEWRNTWAC